MCVVCTVCMVHKCVVCTVCMVHKCVLGVQFVWYINVSCVQFVWYINVCHVHSEYILCGVSGPYICDICTEWYGVCGVYGT